MTPATATAPRQVAGELLRETETVQARATELEGARARRDEVQAERDGLSGQVGELEARLETATAAGDPKGEVRTLSRRLRELRGELEDVDADLRAQEAAVEGAELARFRAMVEAAPDRWAEHREAIARLGVELQEATERALEALEGLRRLDKVRGFMDHQAHTLAVKHFPQASTADLPSVARLLGVSSRDWKEAGDGLTRATTFTAIQTEKKADADD